jgi:simple sugar transport system ATP-binding protein
MVLKRGAMNLDAKRSEITLEELTGQMAGGDELEALAHELKRDESPSTNADAQRNPGGAT